MAIPIPLEVPDVALCSHDGRISHLPETGEDTPPNGREQMNEGLGKAQEALEQGVAKKQGEAYQIGHKGLPAYSQKLAAFPAWDRRGNSR